MYKALIVSILIFKNAVNIFECMEIAEYIYEGVVEPSDKNLPGKTTAVTVTAGIIKEKSHRHGIAPIRVRALERSENDM